MQQWVLLFICWNARQSCECAGLHVRCESTECKSLFIYVFLFQVSGAFCDAACYSGVLWPWSSEKSSFPSFIHITGNDLAHQESDTWYVCKNQFIRESHHCSESFWPFELIYIIICCYLICATFIAFIGKARGFESLWTFLGKSLFYCST